MDHRERTCKLIINILERKKEKEKKKSHIQYNKMGNWQF